jgi:electron transfer flavoprotein beta subunit
MMNMRTVMPALQKAVPAPVGAGTTYLGVELPQQRRETRIVKDMSADDIAAEIVAWIKG